MSSSVPQTSSTGPQAKLQSKKQMPLCWTSSVMHRLFSHLPTYDGNYCGSDSNTLAGNKINCYSTNVIHPPTILESIQNI
jgi:hypothetical protein